MYIPGPIDADGFYLKPRFLIIKNAHPVVRGLWDHIMYNARFMPSSHLEIGQLDTSYKELRNELSWRVGHRVERYSRKQLETAISFLKKENFIRTVRKKGGFIITVLNYEVFQKAKNYTKLEVVTDSSEGGDMDNENCNENNEIDNDPSSQKGAHNPMKGVKEDAKVVTLFPEGGDKGVESDSKKDNENNYLNNDQTPQRGSQKNMKGVTLPSEGGITENKNINENNNLNITPPSRKGSYSSVKGVTQPSCDPSTLYKPRVKNDNVKNDFKNIYSLSEKIAEKKKSAQSKKPSPYPDDFLKFWERYPNKKSKKQAFKTWECLKNTGELPELGDLIKAIDIQENEKREKALKGEWYASWKYPSTWLNAEGWEDKPEPAYKTGPPQKRRQGGYMTLEEHNKRAVMEFLSEDF